MSIWQPVLLMISLSDQINLRSILADRRSGSRDRVCHYAVHDELTCLFRTGNRALDDLSRKTVDLDIHLNRGNAVMRAGYLEVHVAEEVFEALNIGQKHKIVIRFACNKSAGNSGNHLLDRDAGIHQ